MFKISALGPWFVLLFTCLNLYSSNFENLKKAEELADKKPAEALELIQPYLSDDFQFESNEQRFLFYLAAGKTFLFIGEHDKAESYAEQSIQFAVDDLLKTKALILKSSILFRLGRYGESDPIAMEALKLAENLNDNRQIAGAQNLVANIQLVSGNFEQALDHYDIASKMLAEIGDEKAAIKIKANIGNIHLQLRNFDEAITYLEPCFEMVKGSEDAQMQMIIGMNLAAAYGEKGDVEREEQMYLDAKKIAQESGLESFNAGIYINLSDLYIRTESWSKAIEYATNANELATQSNDPASIAVSWVNMGKGYAGLGEFDKTFSFFDKAMSIFEQANAEMQRSEVLGYYAEYYAKAGRFEEAYKAAQAHYDARQKLLSAENLEKLQELRARFETEQKELEIEALETEKEKQNLLLEQQKLQAEVDKAQIEKSEAARNLLILLILIGVVIIITLIIGYSYSVRSNRELKHLHSELNQKNEDLRELNDQKKQLIAIVSHDLRNPLYGILGLMDELRERGQKMDSSEYQELIDMIDHSGNRAMEIVKNLLNSERINSGKLTLESEPCQIADIAKMAIHENTTQARLKEQELVCDIEFESDLNVLGEIEALRHACSNLISNAIKYSGTGLPIMISLKQYDQSVRFAVTDQGEGISEEDQEKLFKPYSTTTLKTTGGEHSVGLGLSIVKSLVEAMNGSVGCTSQQGRGSTFYLELPLLKS